MTAGQDSTMGRFDDDAAGADGSSYELTLFVSGASELSGRAIADTRQLCDAHLAGRYHLSIVDVHDDPAAALSSGVLVAPTLVKNRPLPVRKVVGDLSHPGRVLVALGLAVAADLSGVLG